MQAVERGAVVDEGIAQWPTGRLLSMAARLVEHSWEAVLREYDISSAGLVVLHVVAERPASQREIARVARVTDQTASRTVERLERSGYVAREPDPADERRKVVTATDAGRTVYRELVERERTDPALIAALGDSEPVLRGLLLELIGSQRGAGER
ncbi:MarR family transcriptional regulator [Tsukamurella pulmonis]|uniref:DNA-binding transcriptional regulator, MarR family n=1 Tax=Tsukamurella pulmonis TaxID=47312 RepID=A0A1H1G3H5_9ACTN|nr:MarR family transcriptional regulator [Tsukamurella pulmonis]KXO87809.1 ArsR family transcriptional regulator [Tsukamurella pulmonis]KXP13585.1 ArsR family transcriptional regulator [Tsukamurella pulmonis]SDR07730.1 DNA-binding transcriptional regulator, MarR family [Tsukamurella pulmonis]SUP17952.1 homoprotocatechuate degradation operon regulator, HpaR [Tsukamurella pulmonis]BDD82001.1 MarR family transcriptional regulator [Tsukamurella pulmonis]